MANPEHEAILRQGVDVWNLWQKNNPYVEIDLRDADFSGTDLSYINLSGANLIHVNLSYANLRSANLDNADLSYADLRFIQLNNTYLYKANFSYSNLSFANIDNSNLSYANLTAADLLSANLYGANLSSANLNTARLIGTNLTNAKLNYTNLTEVGCGHTVFANVDLSTAKSLDTIRHKFFSTLGIDTIFQSKGKIPEKFLRGCGVPETLITFLPSMLEEAIQFYSCFISYSHADKEFAKRLHDRLQGEGIRCWLDEHQLNPGDKLHSTIYEAIRLYDKVILCCSETSLKSWWVEKEFENVIAKEEDFHEPLLIPVALDNYLFEQSADEWFIGEIRKKRLVQSFENWKDHDAFEAAFAKVVKALRTDGGKPPPPTPKLTPRK